MIRRRALLSALGIGLFVALVAGAPAGAVPPDPVSGSNGKQWRQLYETTGLSANQVAQVCPRDGITRCTGSVGGKVLTGWVWGTGAQVVELMGDYEPAVLTANPPLISGPEFFMSAAGFLGQMRWTGSISTYGSYTEWTSGWTSTTDESGLPALGTVAFGWWPPAGSLGVSSSADGVDPYRGVWLWRPSGEDLTPPVITPVVDGTAGSNGWYVSDVSVAWEVQDPDSPVSSQVGCDPATVSLDTPGRTFTCEATSAGGRSTASTIVKRDVTAPAVTCLTPAPVFQIYQLGAIVPASVADTTSGPAVSPVYGLANTSATGSFTKAVTGADRAGNRTRRQCPYQVVIPTCNGLTPTRVGTALNDVIVGTSGRDVIVGLGGADTVDGAGGNDVICGNDGPDTVRGGDGNDWINGGASPDDLYGDAGDDVLNGGAGNDSIRGGDGRDTCTSGELRMSSCEL